MLKLLKVERFDMKKKLTVEIVQSVIDTEVAKGNEKECRVKPCMNFLLTLPPHTLKYEDLANLEMDAKLYRWHKSIVRVIKKGIDIAFK